MEKIRIEEIKTEELNKRLENLTSDKFGTYIRSLKTAPNISDFFSAYCDYYRVNKSDIVKRSGLSKSYGYEILNGVKLHPSRDHLIALCLSAQMDLSTTQYVLKLGEAGELYAKVPRDAAIIIHINQKKWDIIRLNIFLEENGLECL